MRRLASKFVGWMILGTALAVSPKVHALACPSPVQPAGTAWCDADASRFLSDTLCAVEPVDGPATSSIDEEVVGAGVCILGKFKTASQLQKLADFVVSYDFPADPLLGPSGLYVPELQTLSGTGEFMTTVPLEAEGVFDIGIQGRILNDDGSFQDLSIVRRVLRVAEPHLTITKARLGGSTSDCSSGGGDCFGVHEDTVDTTVPGHPAHQIQLTPPTGAHAGSVELCVQNHDAEGDAGTAILVRAMNTITDSSATPAKQIVVDSNCAAEGETLCQTATDTFCNGGFKVNVPLGNGSNAIDLFVNNLITGYDVGAGERISLDPVDVDLKGPELCVNYLNDDGHKINKVDGRALLHSEADSVMVDITLGKCGSTPESVTATPPAGCDAENPPACEANSPVCAHVNNEKDNERNDHFTAFCEKEVGGVPHYQMRLNDVLFPITTLKIRAADNLGNQTVDTHYFGYGNVRPLFNKDGNLDVKNAMVPQGVAGFVPADFVKGDLLKVVLKAVNSDKFKNDFFFKLMDPRQPGDEEISCLKSIENDLNCTMDHVASKSRVVAIKTFCDQSCVDEIGPIEVPSIYFLNGNRLRVQLKIKGLHGRAEMYTLQFGDADNDSIVDTEDDDADNDGICDRFIPGFKDCTDANHDGVCDEEISLTGSFGKGLNSSHKCVMDKSVPKENCPDVDAGDKKYFGCQDLDDDNDGVPDDHDLPGRIVPDPDFGVYVHPLRFEIKELALNLDVHFNKDANGRMHVEMTAPPDRGMVEAIPDNGNLIEFDCEKDVSEIYQGGRAGDEGNGQNLWIDSEACKGLKNLSNGLNGNGGFLQGGLISTSEFLGLVNRHKRQNEGTNQQLLCTVGALARCSIPKRLEATLEKFDDEKVAPIALDIQDKKFHMDFYAPLGQSDVRVDPRGLGFSGKGLLLPAGVTPDTDDTERQATDFMSALPAEFKDSKFGPLSKYGKGKGMDAIDAAMDMGSELNLAVNEETINSALHSVALLLWDLGRQPGSEQKQLLDLSATKIREDFDMGIPDIGSNTCKDKKGETVADTSYKCFPFPLDVENVLGSLALKYVDFDGDGVAGGAKDVLTPMILRTGMNPFFPPTVKLVSVSPVESWGGDGPVKAPVILAELEIGLGNAVTSVFEEKVEDWSASPIKGTGVIKSWCDTDRYPGANSTQCASAGGAPLPVARFGMTGRVFVTLMLTVNEDGIIRAEGGISSVERATGATENESMEIDKTKTHVEINVLENNTITPDKDLASALKGSVDLILTKYLFGNARDIRLNVPTQLPLQAFCSKFAEDEPELCDCVEHPDHEDCHDKLAVQRFWDDLDLKKFGLEGVTVNHPVMSLTDDENDPTRFLGIGTDITFELTR